MKFFAAALVALWSIAHAADPAPAPAIRFEELASPAAPRSLGAFLVIAPDGKPWLSWVEAGAPLPAANTAMGDHHHTAAPSAADAPSNTLRFSTFDAAAKKWSAARTIVSAPSVTTNSADFPQVIFDGRGVATAIWTDGHGGALWSASSDRGATWSPPAPWTRASDEVEKFAFVTLADGRILASWLDGRGKKTGAKAQQLFARIIGQTTPDVLVDPSVCDCCQTTLTAFPDGGALLAYRGRTNEEVRDIRTARFDGRAWAAPRPLNNDDWRIAACPVNGPRLASDGGRVAVAWFTAADNDPRVLASYSPDAGARFLQPLRLDNGKPAGHVDTLILHDSAPLVTWIESDGSVWLRRVTPDFTTDAPVRLAPAGATSVSTVPRLALLRDYAGGKTSAQIVVAFAGKPGEPLRTLLVTVPEGELIEFGKNCDCAPTAEQLQGYPIRGTITAIDATRGLVRVQHDESPGVLAAGTHEFTAAPDIIAAAQNNRRFLGRIERYDGAWRVFDVRLFAEK